MVHQDLLALVVTQALRAWAENSVQLVPRATKDHKVPKVGMDPLERMGTQDHKDPPDLMGRMALMEKPDLLVQLDLQEDREIEYVGGGRREREVEGE